MTQRAANVARPAQARVQPAPARETPNRGPAPLRSRSAGGELAATERPRRSAPQPRLEVHAVADTFEHEADRIAREILRSPASAPTGGPRARCRCGGMPGPSGECSACRTQRLARVAAAGAARAPRGAPPSVRATLKRAGRPLDPATRAFFESRLGADLAGVRIHDDALAAASATDVRADAYTVGGDIAFAAGRYRPSTAAGRALLAHELVHTVQQGAMAGGEQLVQHATHGPRLQRQLSTKKHRRVAQAEIVVDHPIDAQELLVLGLMQALRLDREAAEREALTWRPDPRYPKGVTADKVNEPVTVQFTWFERLPLKVQKALDDGYLRRLFLGREARRQLKIPDDIPQPADYRAVLAARDTALTLSAKDVDCWWRWTRGALIASWAHLASWLTAFSAQRADFCDPIDEHAVDSLLGREDVHAAIKASERLEQEIASQPAKTLLLREDYLRSLRARQEALQAAGFGDVAQFNAAANGFRLYFRARAVALIEHSLDVAEQLLRDARMRFAVGSAEAQQLYGTLHAARTPDQIMAAYPVLQGTGALSAISQSRSAYDLSGRLGLFALERLEKLRRVRWHVERDNDIVFKFDVVVNATMERFGVAPDSIHAAVIAEQIGKPGPSIWDRIIDIGLLVLSFVPGPIGFAARVVSTVRDIGGEAINYAQLDTAHEAGYLSKAPSITPVVVAVAANVGPDIAVAAASRGVRALRSGTVADDVGSPPLPDLGGAPPAPHGAVQPTAGVRPAADASAVRPARARGHTIVAVRLDADPGAARPPLGGARSVKPPRASAGAPPVPVADRVPTVRASQPAAAGRTEGTTTASGGTAAAPPPPPPMPPAPEPAGAKADEAIAVTGQPRIGLPPLAGVPTTEADEAITVVGQSQIGVPPLSRIQATTKRTVLVTPGREIVPRASTDPLALRPIGPPQPVLIGNVAVVSRHPYVLVGARRHHHREDFLKVIAEDRDHPLRPLLDESSSAPKKLRFADPGYPRKAGTMEDWRLHPEDMQSAHARSGKAGDAEVLVMDTRYRNQRQSHLQERPGTPGEAAMDEAVVVGGLALTRGAAWDLWAAKLLRLTEEQMRSLPTLHL